MVEARANFPLLMHNRPTEAPLCSRVGMEAVFVTLRCVPLRGGAQGVFDATDDG